MHFSHSFYLTVALDVTLNLQPTMTHLGRRVYTAPKSWENSEWEILLKWEIHEKYCFHFIHYWTNIENTSLKFHWITYLLPDNACLHINSNLKQTTITETLPDLCFWRYINKLYYKQNNIIACNEGSEEGQRTKEQHSHLICDLSYSGIRGCFENLFYALLLWTVQAASMGNATLYDVMWSWLCTFHHSWEQPCRQQSMKTDQKVSDVESSLTLSKWNEGIEAEVHFI